MMRAMDADVIWCLCPNCRARLDACATLVGDLRCAACETVVLLVDQECLFSAPGAMGPFHRAPIERLTGPASVPPTLR